MMEIRTIRHDDISKRWIFRVLLVELLLAFVNSPIKGVGCHLKPQSKTAFM
jgi:hypothetical protein